MTKTRSFLKSLALAGTTALLLAGAGNLHAQTRSLSANALKLDNNGAGVGDWQSVTFKADQTITGSSSTYTWPNVGTGGILQVGATGTVTMKTLTTGRVLFAGSATGIGDNANFFWDNTNSRLGIGTATPATSLDVVGTSTFLGTASINASGTAVTLIGSSTGGFIAIDAAPTKTIEFGLNAGTITIGSTGMTSLTAKKAITVDDAGGANLSVGEATISRAGDLAINPGTGNSITTDGGIKAAEGLATVSNGLANATNTIQWKSGSNGTLTTAALTSDRTWTMPDASGTILTTANGVAYDVTATQNSATNRTHQLFDVSYSGAGSDANAAGAAITSVGGATNRTATGLTITATGTGTAASTGLSVTANGGSGTRKAIDATGDLYVAGNVVQSGGTVSSAVSDNVANAFLVKQGSDNYIAVTTTDAGETVKFGNATTNPATTFQGSGAVTVTGATVMNGNVTLGDAAADLITFNGVANTALDMNDNVINNIGAAGTDFSATGGLTLADNLTVSSGGATITGTTDVVGTTTINTGASTAATTIGGTNGGDVTIDSKSTKAIAIGANSGTITIGSTGMTSLTAKKAITVDDAGGADLSVGEATISRAGDLAINPGTGNSITTDGGIKAAEGLATVSNGLANATNTIQWKSGSNGTLTTAALTTDRTWTMPDASGTLLTTATGVAYDVTATQNSATNRTHQLFDVSYSGAGSDANAAGAVITSVGGATNRSATGLTITATGTGTGSATALSVTASGGSGTNRAITAVGDVSVTGTTIGLTGRTVLTNPAGASDITPSGGSPNVAPSANYAGTVRCTAGTLSYTVEYAGVQANSTIIATYEELTGTGDLLTPYVTAKSAGTSFTITLSGNPLSTAHLNYIVINP